MTVRLLHGDCRAVLPRLPDASVHCIVTSPPYYGLRDYGTAQWEGGNPACGHRQVLGGNGSSSAKQVSSAGTQSYQFRHICGTCGAHRIDPQIGLEQTPDAYVAELVAVFREARRVLRNDGTLWLNLGDGYAGGGNGNGGNFAADRANWRVVPPRSGQRCAVNGLKAKDLLGIPWRVAFALQTDGWWLRQDIIWAKPNPMPESATDRCTKAHEYVFLLSKSARYWYDAEAIAEDAMARRQQRLTRPTDHPKAQLYGGENFVGGGVSESRNRRSVWTIATQPYKGAHFATMPPDLAELCIKAGCPKGGRVLDPFAGAGTTGLVADRLGRDAVLIELNPEYSGLGRARLEADAGLFAQIAEEKDLAAGLSSVPQS